MRDCVPQRMKIRTLRRSRQRLDLVSFYTLDKTAFCPTNFRTVKLNRCHWRKCVRISPGIVTSAKAFGNMTMSYEEKFLEIIIPTFLENR